MMLKNILSALLGFIAFQYAGVPTEITISEPLAAIPEPTQIPLLPTPLARKLDLNETINAIAFFEKIIAKYGCRTLYVYSDSDDKLVCEYNALATRVIGDQEPLDSID